MPAMFVVWLTLAGFLAIVFVIVTPILICICMKKGAALEELKKPKEKFKEENKLPEPESDKEKEIIKSLHQSPHWIDAPVEMHSIREMNTIEDMDSIVELSEPYWDIK